METINMFIGGAPQTLDRAEAESSRRLPDSAPLPSASPAAHRQQATQPGAPGQAHRLRPHKVRVMLVDDHAIVRNGLANLLRDEPDLEIVGEASDGQMAVEQAAVLQPDVILMDISMPRLNGIEATRRIHRQSLRTRVIGLSMHEQADMAGAMREAGAVEYLPKDTPGPSLIEAVRRAAS